MCIPYLEPTPEKKPKKKPPKTNRSGQMQFYGGHPFYGGPSGYGGLPGYGRLHNFLHGTDHGNNYVVVRPPGIARSPWEETSQWPQLSQVFLGRGGVNNNASYSQPNYASEPQMVYTIPQERRELSRTSWADQPTLQSPRSMEVYNPSERRERHRSHGNESSPVVILQTSSRGRERSRSRDRDRDRGCSHRHSTRGASRYYNRRREDSSANSSLYEYRRPRYRRSRSM